MTATQLYGTREQRGIRLAKTLLTGRGLVFERHQQSALSTEPPKSDDHRAVLGGWHRGDQAQRWAIAPTATVSWTTGALLAAAAVDVALLQRLCQRAHELHRIRRWHDSSSPAGTPIVEAFVGSCSLDVLICVVLAELMPGVGWALEQLDAPQLGIPEWHVWLERAMVGVGSGGRREASDQATQLADTLAGDDGIVVYEMLEWAWRIANPKGPLYLCQVDEYLGVTLGLPDPQVPPAFARTVRMWENCAELDAARERLIASGLIDRDGAVEASDGLLLSGCTIIETAIPRFGWVRWVRSGLHGAMVGQRWRFMDRGWW